MTKNCILCARSYEAAKKASRSLYCGPCGRAKRAQWKASWKRKKASQIGSCAICGTAIGGARLRRNRRLPGHVTCPRCSLALNSRLTAKHLRRLADLLDPPRERIFSAPEVDNPAERPYPVQELEA